MIEDPLLHDAAVDILAILMRVYLYPISGLVASLLGWSFAQVLMLDLPGLLFKGYWPSWLNLFLLLSSVAMGLITAMVTTEIFLSNPSRYSANWRVTRQFLRWMLLAGLVVGLGAAVLSLLLYQSNTPAGLVRCFCWAFVGCFIGLGEALIWSRRSNEAASKVKVRQRLWKVPLFGLLAGIFAAIVIELWRQAISLGGIEDPVGFGLLGLSLGFFLNWATAPTYQVALRAGYGFETEPPDPRILSDPNILKLKPILNSPVLRFVSEDSSRIIEEGLSIQLPERLESPLFIGSNNSCHIFIPNIPSHAARLEHKNGKYQLHCIAAKKVMVQRRLLDYDNRVKLIHNQIITFLSEEDSNQFYCFAFYDRFLDPEA